MKSLVYSFGLRSKDHGVAIGVLSEWKGVSSVRSSSSSSPHAFELLFGGIEKAISGRMIF